jgi:ribonuclease BN (tRNA processing enzyme)
VKLIVTGSADAFNAAGRGHSCFWLEELADDPLMIDFGATALQALKRLELDPGRLRTILFTHLHGDHVGGLPFLVIDGMFRAGRQEPLQLVGPPGTRQRCEDLIIASYGPIGEREEAFPLHFCEVEPGQELAFGAVRVQVFAADHVAPPGVALGYRLVREGGPTLVFSGDTSMTDELLAAAANADLLVAECSALEPPAGKHCTWEEWRRVLPDLDVGRLLLVHLPEEIRSEELPEAEPGGPPVQLAEDGMVVELDGS